MNGREGRQDLPEQPVGQDQDSRIGSAQAGLRLRPLLESLAGDEFIVTVLFGKGEGDAGQT